MLCSIVLLAGSIILTYISPHSIAASESYAGNLSVRDQLKAGWPAEWLLYQIMQDKVLIWFILHFLVSELWKWRERDVLEIFRKYKCKMNRRWEQIQIGKMFYPNVDLRCMYIFFNPKLKFASSWKNGLSNFADIFLAPVNTLVSAPRKPYKLQNIKQQNSVSSH